MNQQEPVFGNDYISFREKVRQRIGAERAEQYKDAEPLLALAEYRLEQSKDNLMSGLSQLFDFDTMFGKKPATRIAFSALAPALWGITRIKYAFRKKAETRLVFSNSFLLSRRYPTVREQIEEKYGCTAVLTFLDTIKIETRSTKELIRESLRLDAGRVKPAFIPRFSIAGGKLQRAVEAYYRMIYRAAFGQEPLTEAELDAILPRLRKEYVKRVDFLAKRLGKETRGCT